MLSVCHAKMPAVSTPNLSDIWRSKRPQPVPQRCKQITEREKGEALKDTQTKKRPVQILSRPTEMNPKVKPFHPRNKGLARSEGLWEMYCNQPEPVLFDRPAKCVRSSWPDASIQTTAEQLPGQLENGEESSFLFRLYEEKDFWGYLLPNTLFTKKRNVSWGLSVPTDWQSPIHLSFPITLLEDGTITWEYPQDVSVDSDEALSIKSKSKLLDLFKFVTTDLENENKTPVPEYPTVSPERTDLMESKAGELLEKNNSESEESDNSSDVAISRSGGDKTNVSCNWSYSMTDILFGTPSRSDSRKRRTPGISHIVYESCNFYRSNSSPVLTVL